MERSERKIANVIDVVFVPKEVQHGRKGNPPKTRKRLRFRKFWHRLQGDTSWGRK